MTITHICTQIYIYTHDRNPVFIVIYIIRPYQVHAIKEGTQRVAEQEAAPEVTQDNKILLPAHLDKRVDENRTIRHWTYTEHGYTCPTRAIQDILENERRGRG